MRPTWATLGQTVAVSVATILGTGILGLPVVLHQSGLRPFLVLFTANFIAQLGIVIAMTELLHRAYITTASSTSTHFETTPPHHLDDPLSSQLKPPSVNSSHDAHAALQNESKSEQLAPSLHSLAALFIHSPSLRFIFNVLVIAHFVFILCAYTLAASQAYVALFPALAIFPKFLCSTVFLVIAATLVFTCTPAIISPLSIATLVKAVLLTVLILVTFVRGLSIRRPISTDWSPMVLVEPFLMGTIALSGVVNLMPVTFQNCLHAQPPPSQSSHQINHRVFISAYRSATMLAVFVCYLLNVAWAFAVLFVVPQTTASLTSSLTSSSLPSLASNATLENANALGQISTIPLMEVLKASHDNLNVVIAFLVNSFIAISVTVSFLVMSVGMLHFLKGSVSSPSHNASSSALSTVINSLFSRYWLSFAFVLSIALCNPAGLLKIMEGATSLALNLEAGAFVVYMFYMSRTTNDTEAVASGSVPALYTAVIIAYLIIYYASAVLVDVIVFIPSILTGDR